MRRLLHVLITSMAGLGLIVAQAAPSSAVLVAPDAAKPKLAWQFQSADVDQGGPAVASYQVAGLPKGGKVVLERAFGTAGVFRLVATADQPVGALTVTAPGMGQYTYRMSVKSKSGKKLVWGDQVLRSYGDVPLSQMLNRSTQTVQIGATLFRYTTSSGYNPTTWDPSSCRRLTIKAAQPPSTSNSTKNGSVQIVQERGDMAEIQVPPGQIVEQPVDLFGGAVKMTIFGGNYTTYLDAIGSCFTSDGLVKTS